VVAIARDPGALDIIDPVKLERKVSVQVKGRLHNTYVTPDSKYAIMGSTRTSMFSVVDLAKEELAWDVNIGKGVRPMTIDYQSGRVDPKRLHPDVRSQRLRRSRFCVTQSGEDGRAAK